MLQQGVNQFLGILAADRRSKDLAAKSLEAERRSEEREAREADEEFRREDMHNIKRAEILTNIRNSEELHKENIKTQKLAQNQLQMQNEMLMKNPDLIKEMAMQSMATKGLFTVQQKDEYTKNAGGTE